MAGKQFALHVLGGVGAQHRPHLGHLAARRVGLAGVVQGQGVVGGTDGQGSPRGGLVGALQELGHGLAQRGSGLGLAAAALHQAAHPQHEGLALRREQARVDAAQQFRGTVQYHPEAGPGPNDALYLFDRFLEQINAAS